MNLMKHYNLFHTDQELDKILQIPLNTENETKQILQDIWIQSSVKTQEIVSCNDPVFTRTMIIGRTGKVHQTLSTDFT